MDAREQVTVETEKTEKGKQSTLRYGTKTRRNTKKARDRALCLRRVQVLVSSYGKIVLEFLKIGHCRFIQFTIKTFEELRTAKQFYSES